MATDPYTASFGGAPLLVDPHTGVLTWDGSDVIILRVDLINRLFGPILKIPGFSTLLREAGLSAGVDYAAAFLRREVPRAAQHGNTPAADDLTDEDIKHIWRQMNELDTFGGWGKAELIQSDKAASTATVRVTASFTGRQKAYWAELGFGPESGRTTVCSFLEGYFLGEGRILLGRETLTCEEVACQVDGHSPVCEFKIRPTK